MKTKILNNEQRATLFTCSLGKIEGNVYTKRTFIYQRKQVKNMSIQPGIYTHFKGNNYEVLGTATHSETLEEMVVYRPLSGNGTVWVRPLAMWNEIVEHDGKRVQRFVREETL